MKKYIITIFLTVYFIVNLNGQNFMFDNVSFRYTKSKTNNIIDTVFLKFTLKKIYKKKHCYIGAITFDFGLTNDTVYYSISSRFVSKRTKIINFYSTFKENRIITKDNYNFECKLPILDLKLQEINFASFFASYSSRFHKKYRHKCSHDPLIVLKTIKNDEWDRLSKINRDHQIFISR